MKRNRLPLVVLAAWDTGWKIAAIRKAIKNRQYRWIAPLVIVNSVGIFPMLYLRHWAKPRGKAATEIVERTG